MTIVHAASPGGVLRVDDVEGAVVVPRAGCVDGVEEAAGVVGLRADKLDIRGLRGTLHVHVAGDQELIRSGLAGPCTVGVDALGIVTDALGFDEATCIVGRSAS